MIMRDTVFCAIGPDADRDAITASIHEMVDEVQQYVPGYSLRADPQFDDAREDWDGNAASRIFLEVRGNGDYLPEYAGNLDIMTAAAARVGELMARAKQEVVRMTRRNWPTTSGSSTRRCATAATRWPTASPSSRCATPSARSTAPASR